MKTRRQWERWCLGVAVIGGNVSGALSAGPALLVLFGLQRLPFWIYNTHRFGVLVLTFSIAILARSPKRLTYWVFVSAFFWVSWNIAGSLVKQNWAGVVQNFQNSFVDISIGLIVMCGFALVTGDFGKGRVKPNVRGEPHLEPQDGVWPPAPRQP